MILVLDFGSQYNQLIVRRIREFGVYSELHSHRITPEKIRELNVKGIVFSGGPNSVNDEENGFFIDEEIFNMGIPIFGICYGMQLIAKHFNGKIEKGLAREYGKATLNIDNKSPLFKGLDKNEIVWMSHGDHVSKISDDFKIIGSTDDCPVGAVEKKDGNIFGVQFHPEVVHSIHGNDILKNFVFGVCKEANDWDMGDFIEEEVEKIRNMVGENRVICGLSGGVDSSVVAALLYKAIGDKLTCIFVDHGLLRKDEGASVMKIFAEDYKIDVIKVDCKDRFLNKLKGVSDPETKRKIIGNEFVYVFDDESKKLKDAKFLAQGTLYTDVIESGTETAQTIKSHHNVGGLPEDMEFKLIEPLNTLFKDEVRVVGERLGLPHDLVWRQPFPGPGLGIRVLGEITEEKLEIVRESDWILREEIKRHGLDKEIWQYFTALPDMRSVGVMGDERTYDYTVGIRAVTSIDGMTANWARIPYDVLEIISNRIVNEVPNVNRVVYDVTSKPPATVEWE